MSTQEPMTESGMNLRTKEFALRIVKVAGSVSKDFDFEIRPVLPGVLRGPEASQPGQPGSRGQGGHGRSEGGSILENEVEFARIWSNSVEWPEDGVPSLERRGARFAGKSENWSRINRR